MEAKEKITALMGAGFTLDEALEMIAQPAAETETETETETEATPAGSAGPEAQQEEPAADQTAIISAIDELKKTIAALTKTTQAAARLQGIESKSSAESADDILSKLG